MNRLTFVLLIITVSSVSSACKKKKVEKSKNQFVVDQLDYNITDGNEAFYDATNVLHYEMSSLVNTPSISQLEKVRALWKDAAQKYMVAKAYDIDAAKDEYAHLYIGSWPVDTSKIKTQIQSFPNNVDVPSKVKGLFAIEWMLFNVHTVDSIFNMSHYNTYLLNISEDLEHKASTLRGLWESNYETFSSNEGEDKENSFNQLANGLIQYIDRIKYQIGLPLGKMDLDIKDSLRNISPYAGMNKTLIDDEIMLVEAIWNGTAIDGSSITSLKASVEIVNEDLVVQIDQQLEVVKNQTNNVQDLSAQLYTNPQEIEKLYTEVGKLLTLFKSDLVSEMGITLLFSDNDGD